MISIEDKLAIQELIARFAHCSDFGDWEGLAELYTVDVTTEMDGISLKYSGVDAQIEHAKASDSQAGGKNRHYNFNMYIEDDGEQAVAKYCFLNVNAGGVPLESKIITSGRMHDTVVKIDGVWKIARRRVIFDQKFDLDF